MNEFEDHIERDYNKVYNIGVKDGLGGVSLFYLMKFLSIKNREDINKSLEILNQIIEKVNSGYNHEFFYNELTELLYLIDLIENVTGLRKYKILAKQIEGLIFDYSKRQIEEQVYDPTIGAFFPAFYFLYKSQRKPLDDLYLKTIDTNIIKVKDDVFIFDSNFDKSKLYLSFSHGVCAYLLFLCELYKVTYKKESVISLTKGLFNFIYHSILSDESSLFDLFCTKSIEKEGGLSLSYGNATVIYSLFKASKIFEIEPFRKRVINEAIETLINDVSNAIFTHSNVSFYYGLSGLYILFWNFYHDYKTQRLEAVLKKLYSILINCENDTRFSKGNSLAFQEGLLGAYTLRYCTTNDQMSFISKLNMVY